jgi:hypothetical protein
VPLPKYSILFCQFPGNNITDPDVSDWVVETAIKMKADPRIGDIIPWRLSDTPITMGRNRALKQAKKLGSDFVLMIDSDMKPDCYLPTNGNKIADDPNAKPFWETAFEHLLQHKGPAVCAAPYCGPPPVENVYIFKWTNFNSSRDRANRMAEMKLEQFTRDEAAFRTGIEEVAALPTGLMLMHTACLDKITEPYTYYEWSDKSESEKASTEDVTFTRDMSLVGIPQYCLWDCWAGHWKRICVGKPIVPTVDMIREQLHAGIISGRKSSEKLMMVNEGRQS